MVVKGSGRNREERTVGIGCFLKKLTCWLEWVSNETVADCDICRKLYERSKEEPPCKECDKPTLLPENQLSWEAWTFLSTFRPNHGFGIESLSFESIMNFCELYNISLQDMEKIFYIEKKVVAVLRSRVNK